jgi:Domain of unknown function (DUF4386)
MAALASGKDAVVELPQGLLKKVIAQQANPVGTVSGSADYDDNDYRVAVDKPSPQKPIIDRKSPPGDDDADHPQGPPPRPVTRQFHQRRPAMATTAQSPATRAAPMTSTRKTALVTGVFYLITFVSIPTLALYGPVKNHRDWILSSGGHTGVLVGGFLEVIVALAGIGTAVTLYPVVKRQNEGVALGFVAARVVEAGLIFTGVLSLLSLVTLRQDLGGAAGTDPAALVTAGASHVAIYNWAFLLGQSLMPGINALLLGSLMYRSRLVPRIIPVVGLIGAPILIASVVTTLFRTDHQITVLAAGFLPVAVWEFSLGVWLVVKGFRPCPITAEIAAEQGGLHRVPERQPAQTPAR